MARIWNSSPSQSRGARGLRRRLNFVRPVLIERLEDRIVLSNVSFSGSTLIVEGNAFANFILLRVKASDPNFLEIDDDNDGADHTVPRSQFDRILVDGKGGDDILTLNESNGSFTDTERVTLVGGNGDDHLNCFPTVAGPVEMDGGSGDDRIFGTPGNDTIKSGTGNDELEGSLGNDLYIITLEGGLKTLEDEEGLDTVSFAGAPSAVTFSLVTSDTPQNLGNATQVHLKEGVFESATGTAFNDTLTGNNFSNILSGAGGNDTLNGVNGNDTLLGGAGDDSAVGGDGTDSLDGNTGNDTLRGEARNDTLTGGGGNDLLDGASDNDTYILKLDGNITIADTGGLDNYDFSQSFLPITIDLSDPLQALDVAGHLLTQSGTIERVFGSLASDVIRGNSVANLLDGGPLGNDTIFGDADDDLTGGPGNNTFVVNFGNPDQVSILTDTGGQDTLDFTTAASGLALDLNLINPPQTINSLGTEMVLRGTFENVVGSPFNDSFTGNTAANNIQAGGGADSILGGGGNDTLNGGAGIDTLRGDAGNDNLNGGGEGDFLEGGLGLDTLVGAGGDDTYTFGAGIEGGDRVTDNGGSDRLDFARSPLAVTINLALDASQVQTFDSAGHTVALNGAIEKVTGSEFADLLNGSAAANSFLGLAGNDTINGFAGNDTINGSSDNDLLNGGDNDDSLLGGTGDDSLFGENGNDTLSGGSGVDVEDGGPGQDGIVIEGTSGNDVIRIGRQIGPNGAQVVVRINGQTFVEDYLSGETIFVRAGAGNDLVVFDETAGETWSADIQGGAGRDTLRGTQRADTLDGGAGRDVLIGREGDDILIGGAGRDRFVGGPGVDQIFAEDGARDRIFADFDDVAGSLDNNDRIRGL